MRTEIDANDSPTMMELLALYQLLKQILYNKYIIKFLLRNIRDSAHLLKEL